MRRRVLLTLVFPMVLLALTFVAFAPASAFAASSPATKSHTPHFFLKPSAQQTQVVPFASRNMTYHGGPVEAGTTSVYAIFWEPTGNVSSRYNSLIKQYFGDVGGSTLYRNNTQYTNSSGGFASNSKLAGSWVDSASYPESPLLDSDIQHEVSRAQSVNGWTSSNTHIFFVFTQRNENICFDSSQSQCASNVFCAYHDFFGTNTLYATMPYAASFSCNPGSSPNGDDADQTINVTSHEQMEAATDPLLNAWFDSSGNEIGDKCAWRFGTLNGSGGDVTFNGHSYILQKEWDNHTRGCVLSGP